MSTPKSPADRLRAAARNWRGSSHKYVPFDTALEILEQAEDIEQDSIVAMIQEMFGIPAQSGRHSVWDALDMIRNKPCEKCAELEREFREIREALEPLMPSLLILYERLTTDWQKHLSNPYDLGRLDGSHVVKLVQTLTRHKAELASSEKCRSCQGSGSVYVGEEQLEMCPDCKGVGYAESPKEKPCEKYTELERQFAAEVNRQAREQRTERQKWYEQRAELERRVGEMREALEAITADVRYKIEHIPNHKMMSPCPRCLLDKALARHGAEGKGEEDAEAE